MRGRAVENRKDEDEAKLIKGKKMKRKSGYLSNLCRV
jgi:hypothetical protein